MRETVDIDGLADKVFGKYLKFIQSKATTQGPHLDIKIKSKSGLKALNKGKPAAPQEPEQMQTPTDLGAVG